MGALTSGTPKPFLEVGGRTILERILSGLRSAGIRLAVVVTGHLGDRIVAAFGSGDRLGIEIAYCWQQEPRGTAEALLRVEAEIGTGPFVLGWGDILVDPDFCATFAAAFATVPCDVDTPADLEAAGRYFDAARNGPV